MPLHPPRPGFPRWLLLVAVAWLGAQGQPPAAGQDLDLPRVLEPWIPWVLAGRDARPCPLDPVAAVAPDLADAGSGDPSDRLCTWPGRLQLDLAAGGGRFTQRWVVYADSWVPLPGDATAWPQDTANAQGPLAVVLREGRPSVKLPIGEHVLGGRFLWARLPEGLTLPAETGLVSLTLDGAPIEAPRRGPEGRLWLRDPPQGTPADARDRLGVRVYRHVDDDLPLRVTTRLELEVAGAARLVTLGPASLPGGLPLRLESPIPARLEPDGRLQLQVRPGSWVVELQTQHPGEVLALTRPQADPPWPEQEVWSFAPRPDLRQAEVLGSTRLDPLQSGVPPAWSRLPAYRLGPAETLSLHVGRRGDPDPGPDRLGLTRDLWLDFQGGGYSVRDQIQGTLTRSWRLDLAPPLVLGQARVDGEPRLITRLSDGDPPGVEVRRGALHLVADSRLEGDPSVVPASGWRLDLGSIEARLHLPPGWDLLAVSGVDNLPDTWLSRWTLLDLFLVMILALGASRLWGWTWGLLGLCALVLTWQAPGAPRMVWLHLLAAVALLRLLPGDGGAGALARIRTLVLWYYRLVLLALLLVGLPFLADQVDTGIWPQLERPWLRVPGAGGGAPSASLGMVPPAAPPVLPVDGSPGDQPQESRGLAPDAGGAGSPHAPVAPGASTLDRPDPDARVQTGAGVPEWSWSSYDLVWKGPVPPGERARLWLLSPRWHLVWSLGGALLLTLLGLRLGGVFGAPVARAPDAPTSGPPQGGTSRRLLAGSLLVLGLVCVLPWGRVRAEPLPTPELLGELRERLLAPPDCLPDCVELADLELLAGPELLRLVLTLDAAVPLAAPVLDGAGGWLPQGLRLDGEPLDSVRLGAGQRLLIPLKGGRHRVELSGPLPNGAQVDLSLPLVPRQVRTEISGWTLEGLDPSDRPGGQLRLIRLPDPGGAAQQTPIQGALPPLLRLDRTLRLGIDWRVDTRVRRLSPSDSPVLLPVPLLPGESVQTPGLEERDGLALVGLGPGVEETGWTSTLEPRGWMRLRAPDGPEIVDAWSLDLSPRWHLRWEGIPPVGRGSASERWSPQWRPLPGETLDLEITRPDPLPGPTLTLDRVGFEIRPGRRASAAELRLALRSTLGGTHPIRLPAGAEPMSLVVDGQERPLPPPGTPLELPLVPGDQSVTIAWREPAPLQTSLRPRGPDLGAPAVNLSLSLALPEDRWVLYAGGPPLGPVVLFWPLLLVLIGLALALGRLRLTPLGARDWLLLGIGLGLAQPGLGLVVAGWLIALGLRRRLTESGPRWHYNLVQVGLVVLTVGALGGLIAAISQGLLGHPDMQIRGNGSHGGLLNWYQDRGGPGLPEVWVLSVPIWVYRGLMLAWALWLALRLLDWARWGWEGFREPLLWRTGRVEAVTPAGPARQDPRVRG